MSAEERMQIEDCFEAIEGMVKKVKNVITKASIKKVDLDDNDAVEKLFDFSEYKAKWLAAWVNKGSDEFSVEYDDETKKLVVKF